MAVVTRNMKGGDCVGLGDAPHSVTIGHSSLSCVELESRPILVSFYEPFSCAESAMRAYFSTRTVAYAGEFEDGAQGGRGGGAESVAE